MPIIVQAVSCECVTVLQELACCTTISYFRVKFVVEYLPPAILVLLL